MRRTFLILAGLLLITAAWPRLAYAHAELTEAFPTPGSTVDTLTEIRLTFSEPIGADGQIELLQDFVSAATLTTIVEDEAVLKTAVPPLPDGIYTVQWTVTSADGHTLSGNYSLGINATPPRSETPWYLSNWALLGLMVGSFGVAALILRRWKPLKL